MTGNPPLDTIYTAEEAAERLRLTSRGVIKLGRQYGLCSRRGRDYLFSEADILELWQVMREPAKERKPPTVHVRAHESSLEELRWLFRPRVPVDCREFGVLRLLSKQRAPCTHKRLERAGPRTIEKLLKLGFAVEVERDEEQNPKIRITPEGRDQIAIVDRWAKLRIKHGKSPGGWARSADD